MQYKNTIGYTNPDQRKKDLIECGFKRFDNENFNLYDLEEGMTFEKMKEKQNNMKNCIKNKGYIMFFPAMCTYHGQELGICN